MSVFRRANILAMRISGETFSNPFIGLLLRPLLS